MSNKKDFKKFALVGNGAQLALMAGDEVYFLDDIRLTNFDCRPSEITGESRLIIETLTSNITKETPKSVDKMLVSHNTAFELLKEVEKRLDD